MRIKNIRNFKAAKSVSQSDRGGILMLLLLALPIIVLLVAGGLFVGFKTVLGGKVQSIADATTLAAARQLAGGSKQSFDQVPDAVELVLRKSEDFYGLGESLSNFRFTSVEADGARMGQLGNMKVHLRRGLYWSDESGKGVYSFKSVEPNLLKSQPKDQLVYGLPPQLIANAVEIQFEADIPTFLPNVLGVGTMHVVRTARAVTDVGSLEFEGAIAAIPACDLLLDTNPGDPDKYQTESYVGKDQCEREIVVTQANPKGPSDEEDTGDGILRSDSYPLPPYFDFQGGNNLCVAAGFSSGSYLNCKAIPIQGVMGVPSSVSGSVGKASPDDLLKVAASSNGSVTMRVGQAFNPLEGTALLKDPTVVGRLSDSLAAQINDPANKLYAEVFGTVSPSGKDKRKRNAPRLRHLKSNALNELDLTWPPGDEEHTMGMADMDFGRTNPLCTNPRIFGDDDTKQRVKTIKVVLIASQNKNYCDFESVFTNQEQNTFAPEAKTKPVIVGIKTAYLFDFNLEPLTDPVNNDRNPASVRKVFFSRYANAVTHFVEEHDDWRECRKCQRQKKKCDDGEETDKSICDSLDCTDPCGDAPKDEPAAPPAPQPTSNWQQQCIIGPDATFISWLSDPEKFGGAIRNAIRDPDISPRWGNFNQKCFPKKIEGCFPSNDPSCWEDPRPRAVQYGCAGLRLRLPCTDATLSSSSAVSKMQQGLVK